MKTLARIVVFLSLTTLCLCEFGDPWNYDHQNTTYVAKHDPISLSGIDITVTPFFSPDHAVDIETEFIENASKYLDIGIPSVSSWSGCTDYWQSQDVGCSVSQQRHNESFPLFPAILNAINRGVHVRILTNYFEGEGPSEGLITPLEFLKLAGADVRYFTSVTFLHTKYLQADKKRAIISSINWSKTSIMKNREEGVVVEGDEASPLLDYLRNVFDGDFGQAPPWPVLNHYSKGDLDIITDKTQLPVPKPTPWPFSGAYVSGRKPIKGKMDVTLFASPDNAWKTLHDALKNTDKSLGLFIYQVTDTALCEALKDIVVSPLKDVKMLISHNVFDEGDWKKAEACYIELAKAGLYFRKTKTQYSYSHCKYWILDGKTVQLSTGNWSPTDYPDRTGLTHPHEYPPYTESGWTKTNRDYTISFTNSEVVDVFQKVLDEDYSRGSQWTPSSEM